MGLDASAAASSSGCAAKTARVAADLAPGQMTLTRICHGAHSRAAVRLAARNASLATLYDVVPMWALTPFSEHRLMTAPSRFAFMIGSTACMPQKGPSRPMERPHCICSSVMDSKRPSVPPPQALFTRMSTVPQISYGGGDHGRDVVLGAGVGVDEAHVGAELVPTGRGHRCAGVVVDFGHQDVGALAGEAPHDAPPDAVTSARHDRHLVAESIGHDGLTVARGHSECSSAYARDLALANPLAL